MNARYNISLLLIDHYDSFTYNLYDMLAQLTVTPPQVIAKDAFQEYNVDDWSHIDGIILSPGPGTPQEQPALSCQSISKNPNLPILGVCLGHQLLALEYGANVDKAPKPIHGQDHWISTTINNDDNNDKNSNKLFENVPKSFRVVRYHSLAASNLTSQLQVTAQSEDDHVIQGIQHVSNPHYGVQFHPESIGSQYGMTLLNNFCQTVQDYKSEKPAAGAVTSSSPALSTPTRSLATTANTQQQERQIGETARFRVLLQPVEFDTSHHQKTIPVPARVFAEFYGHHDTAMWLDSSSYPSRGDLDIMAAPSNDKDDIIEYHIFDAGERDDVLTQLQEQLEFAYDMEIGWVSSASSLKSDDGIFQEQNQETIEWTKDTSVAAAGQGVVFEQDPEAAPLHKKKIPFDYRGGYLGYLGYEVRHDTQRHLKEMESASGSQNREAVKASSRAAEKETLTTRDSTPDDAPTGAFFLARESMIYHHPTRQWYLLGLVETEKDVATRLEWMKRTTVRMNQLVLEDTDDIETNPKSRVTALEEKSSLPSPPTSPSLAFVPNRSKERYAQDIADCHEFIELGESYELCLTNQLEATLLESGGGTLSSNTLNLYQRLRRKNPAPYSAYLSWKSNLAICCSSPERFMSVQRKPTNNHPCHPTTILLAEAKPIKGTCARVLPANGQMRTLAETREDERRARSLELSLKNRAENLMIVDLLRNDMSRVCQIGSVHVAKLMDIESFATVHQMVSTIRGTLPSDSSRTATSGTIDLLRASFPGGSMTGAPKIRTMELLEELEDNVDRGPYSGSLGYLSINGCMDMNIIIRSAIVKTTTTTNADDKADKGQRQYKISIGAGGAITALSETQDEYDEMLLKAKAVVESVQEWAADLATPTKQPPSPKESQAVEGTENVKTPKSA